jgi:glucosamine--fructose-6-phosphate aminotransferase (isomerizing)
MCGICGYIGYDTSFIYGYLGILKLLNRGYDSVGITTINKNQRFMTHKFASDDAELADAKILKHQSAHDGTISILHSRWRTIGAKSDVNSHPHHDMYNQFSLVHNGIVENYAELRAMLVKNGFRFLSETDTEVIVNLISYFYKDGITPIDAIQTALSHIEGTYALAILCVETPDTMYCVRHGSPLLVGFSADNRFMMVSSECYGFDHKITKYVSLASNDIVSLRKEDGVVVMKSCGNTIYEKRRFEGIIEAINPAPYPHWTLKEINDQATACVSATGNGGRIVSDTEVKLGGLDMKRAELMSVDNIVFLGCGTSYHAGLLTLGLFKKLKRFHSVQIFDGAEFTESDMPSHGKTCYVFLSQSGETKDLHRSLEMINAIARNAISIGVINVVDSLIAREVDCGVYLNCGRENAVASTKAFTSQVVVLTMIATWFKQSDHKQTPQVHHSDHSVGNEVALKQTPQVHQTQALPNSDHNSDLYIPKIRRLNNDIIQTIETATESCKRVAKALVSSPSVFILGKENYVSVAKEGSLKMKEIGYIHAEGYSSAALKHGPYALLSPGFPVILLTPGDESFVRNQGVFDELKSRGALVIGISDCELSDAYDYKIRVPTCGYTELLTNVVLQLIAYYLSIEKGINPDYPRNIAKVLSTD